MGNQTKTFSGSGSMKQTMEALKLIIPGRPVPAVRMTQKSKYKSKQAQRYLAYKQQVGWTAIAAGARLSDMPMTVNAIFYINAKRRDMDIDNVAKSLMDGLNGITWHDDHQVIALHIEKVYVEKGEEEKAEIEIREAGA